MSKKITLATEQIRKNFPKPLKILFSDERIKLNSDKKVYDVGLYSPTAHKRLENTFHNLKKELGVIIICPLGTFHNTARTKLENKINEWN